MLEYRVIHWFENDTDHYVVGQIFIDDGVLFSFELINEPWSRKQDMLKEIFESFLLAFDKPIIERSEFAGQIVKCDTNKTYFHEDKLCPKCGHKVATNGKDSWCTNTTCNYCTY